MKRARPEGATLSMNILAYGVAEWRVQLDLLFSVETKHIQLATIYLMLGSPSLVGR